MNTGSLDLVSVRTGTAGKFEITWQCDQSATKTVQRSASEIEGLYKQLARGAALSPETRQNLPNSLSLKGTLPVGAYILVFSCAVAASAAALSVQIDSPDVLLDLLQPHAAELDDRLKVVLCISFCAALSVAALAYVASARLFEKRYEAATAAVAAFLEKVSKDPAAKQHLRALLEPSEREDWPSCFGRIDLERHDLPHPKSETEWWYFNAHLDGEVAEDEDNRKLQYSVFVCFFRFLKHVDKKSGKRYYSHALTWALSDVESKKYYTDVLLESDSPQMILKSLDRGDLMKDPIISRALREVLLKGNVPLPDRLFQEAPTVDAKKLHIKYETSTLTKDSAGNYLLSATHPSLPCSLNLSFQPKKAPVRHGNNGVVKGLHGDDMFYYCISRCAVTGQLQVPEPVKAGGNWKKSVGRTLFVSGNGWYDHEFGGKVSAGESGQLSRPEQNVRYAWNWVAAQLSNGCEITAAVLLNPDTKERMEVKAIVVDKDGQRSQYDETDGVVFEPIPHASKTLEMPSTAKKNKHANGERQSQPDSESSPATRRSVKSETPGSVFEEANVEEEVKDSDPIDIPVDTSSKTETEEATESWRSLRTFQSYPTCFRLTVPARQVNLTVRATFSDQELMTLIAKPAFWEGRCDVNGAFEGKEVDGLAYVERNGFAPETSISSFFKNVGKLVRSSVSKHYPFHPTKEEAIELIATKDTKHYVKGVPLDKLGETLMKPVREIADRGGKSWRSYGALACVDCVGGDSRDFAQWIAMPEFMHVGSLIVDDIQDKSDTRRGGKCAHLLYGEPLCINAGTAAYFQCEQLIRAPGLTADELNKCYGLYFSALRGGHAGQALDIYGLDYMMDEVVESGHGALLEERILAIHMLKTAAPAGTLARMGALVGKGTEEQVEAMGRYFESVGLAFQIMDDVLNLRGLYSKRSDKMKVGTALKRLGEDIVEGKVTMPLCKAMGILESLEQRKELWEAVSAKPQEQAVVDEIIYKLESLGAVQACVEQADTIVNEAWRELDSVIPDSFAKIMLRSFGWFVIERCG